MAEGHKSPESCAKLARHPPSKALPHLASPATSEQLTKRPPNSCRTVVWVPRFGPNPTKLGRSQDLARFGQIWSKVGWEGARSRTFKSSLRGASEGEVHTSGVLQVCADKLRGSSAWDQQTRRKYMRRVRLFSAGTAYSRPTSALRPSLSESSLKVCAGRTSFRPKRPIPCHVLGDVGEMAKPPATSVCLLVCMRVSTLSRRKHTHPPPTRSAQETQKHTLAACGWWRSRLNQIRPSSINAGPTWS